MITKGDLKSGLFCKPLHRAGPCSFATIPNALRSRHGGTLFSQTIIHSALCKDLNEKLPDLM